MKVFKKYLVFIPILCILLMTCTPIVVSATDYDFVLEFPFEEPIVDEWTGYIIQPRYEYNFATGGNYVFDLIFWVITPILTDSNTSIPNVAYNYYAGSKIELIFGTGVQDVAYSLSVYRSSSQGNSSLGQIIPVYTGLISYDDSYTFTLDLTSRYDQFGRPTFKNVQIFDTTWAGGGPVYSVLWSSDSTIYRELLVISSKLNDLITSQNNTVSQLQNTYALLNDYLKKIFSTTDSISGTLDRIWEDFYYWTWTVDEHHETIISLLEQAINGEAPPNQDSFQDSYDDYADIEQDLINNEEASNAIGDFDVSIEGGAYSVIWNMITDFLNSNSKVFGLFIACLTLAFIALLLHR